MTSDRYNAEPSIATSRSQEPSMGDQSRLFLQTALLGQTVGFWLLLVVVFVLSMTPIAIPKIIASLKLDNQEWLPIRAASDNAILSGMASSEPFFLIGWDDTSSAAKERVDLLQQKLETSNASLAWPWYPRTIDLSTESSQATSVLAVTLSPKLIDSAEGVRAAIDKAKLIATQQCGVALERLHLGGPVVENLAVADQAARIIGWLVPMSMLACFGLYYLLTNQARLTLLLAMIASIASLITFSLVYYAKLADWALLGQSEVWLSQADTFLLMLPALVFSLTYATGTQLIESYRANQITTDNMPAPWNMLKQTWKANLLIAFVSAIVLLSLLVSGLVPVQRVSIYLSVGILVGTALLLSLLPMSLDALAKLGLSPKKPQHEVDPWLNAQLDWGFDRYREALIVGLLLMLVAGMSFPFATNRSFESFSLLSQSNRVAEDQAWFMQTANVVPTLYAKQHDAMQREAVRTQPLALTVALLGTACLLIARTRSEQLVVALIAPTLFTMVVTLGLAKVLNQPMGVGTILAVMIGVCFTLGQTLQFRNWMQVVSNDGIDNYDLLQRSWLRSIPASTVASCVMIAGVSPFWLTSFGPAHEFSVVTIIWFPTSLIAVAVVFPAAWLFVQRLSANQTANASEETTIKLLPPPHWFEPTEEASISQMVDEEHKQALEEILAILPTGDDSFEVATDEKSEEKLELKPVEAPETNSALDTSDASSWRTEQELADSDHESLRKRLRRFRRSA